MRFLTSELPLYTPLSAKVDGNRTMEFVRFVKREVETAKQVMGRASCAGRCWQQCPLLHLQVLTFARNLVRNVTKFAPNQALTLIACDRLAFVGLVVLHRVVVQKDKMSPGKKQDITARIWSENTENYRKYLHNVQS